MVSIVYNHRAIPLYFCLLNKKRNSNLTEQKQVLLSSSSLLKEYKIVVLGDREFCGVDLAKWLSVEQEVYLSCLVEKE